MLVSSKNLQAVLISTPTHYKYISSDLR
ncbi:protein of unknown function [Streptococcus thermophilus]|nr:protein of unknown function [Streptococcus thermophilus]